MNADRRARLARVCAVRALVTETAASLVLAGLEPAAGNRSHGRAELFRRVAPEFAVRPPAGTPASPLARRGQTAPTDVGRGPRA